MKQRQFIRVLLAVLATALTLMAAWGFFLSPALERFSAASQDYKSRKKILEEYMALIADADSIHAAYPRYARYFQAQWNRDEQEGSFLRDIESMARAAAVQIVGQQPYKIKDGPEFTDIELQIDMEASFRSLTNFLHALEYSDKLMRLSRIRIAPKDNDPALFRCQAEILKRYFK